MDKAALLDAFRDHLRSRLVHLQSEQRAAREGTRVDGSHRPANRGERAAVTSQSYLALGLAQRVQAIAQHLTVLERITPEARDEVSVGALVCLEDEDGEVFWVLLLPGGEGTVLPTDNGPVTVLSAQAPLVRDLVGEGVGADAWVRRAGREMAVEVIALL